MPGGAWLIGAIGFAALTAAALWLHQPREPQASKALLDSLLAEGTPHVVGTPEGVAHAERVGAALEEAGVPVVFQRTQVGGLHGGPVKLVNVLGRIEGRHEGPATMITAHHDSVAAGPGAGDDGAGVVTVIETARILAKEGTERNVIFLLTDGEEYGLLGAIAFAMEHPWFDEIGAVVNLDARGASGPCHVYELGFGHRELVELMRESLPRPVTSSLADEIYRHMPNGSDFIVYRRVGLPGFNLAFIGGQEHYHQATDVPEHLDAGTLAHMQESALALVRALDRAPPLPNGKSPTLGEWRSRLSIGDPTARQELRRAELGTAPEPSPQSFASFAQRWVLAFDAGLAPYLAAAVAFVMLLALSIAWWRGMLDCSAWWGALGRVMLLLFTAGGVAAATAGGMQQYGSAGGAGWLKAKDVLLPDPWWPWITALWTMAFVGGMAFWQLIPRRSAWANVSAAAIVLMVAFGTAAFFIPATAALLLPISAASAAALLFASILPLAIARYAAAFAGCIQLWALTAVLMPVEPSLVDAFGFSLGAASLVARPLLFVLAFVVLLPGAAPNVIVEPAGDVRPARERVTTTSSSAPRLPPPTSTAPSPWAPPSAPLPRTDGAT